MSKNIKACLTSTHDNWKTPSKIYEAFMEKGYIDTFKYESTTNELENNYRNKKLYMNPPFSKMKECVEWAIKQHLNGNYIYILMPSRTDTEYFHKLLGLHPTIYFIKGRLKYNDTGCAPFPSMLIELAIYNFFPIYRCINQEEIKDIIK